MGEGVAFDLHLEPKEERLARDLIGIPYQRKLTLRQFIGGLPIQRGGFMKKVIFASLMALVWSGPARSETSYDYETLDYSKIAGISVHLGMEPKSVFFEGNKPTFESKRIHKEIMEEYEAEARKISAASPGDLYYEMTDPGIPVVFGPYNFKRSQQVMCVPIFATYAPPRNIPQGGTYQSVFSYIGPTTTVRFFYGDSDGIADGKGTHCTKPVEPDPYLMGKFRYHGFNLQMQDDATGEALNRIIQTNPVSMKFTCGPLSLYKGRRKQTLACRIYSFQLITAANEEVATFRYEKGDWVSDRY
jgi:hypothetical protein